MSNDKKKLLKMRILNALKDDFRLLFCTGIIMIMLIARDIIGIGISDIVVTAICALSMFSLKFEKMVSLIFFLFPIMCGVPGYIISVAYILLVVKGPRIKSRQIVPLVVVAVLEIINESYRDNEGLYTGILSFLSFTAVFFYLLDEREKTLFPLQKSLLFYGIGTSFVFLVIFTNMFQEYGVDAILSGMLRSGALGVEDNDVTKMRGHLALNSNTIAYMAVSAITIFSVMLERIREHKWIYFVVIFICLVSGLLSFSRTFILTILLFFVLLFIASSGANKIKLTFVFIIVGAVGLYMFHDAIFTMMDTFVARSEEGNIETAGKRTILFALYNEAWLSDLKYVLFGAGTVSYFSELCVFNAMHCGLQQIWVCLGLFGFTLYFIRTIMFFKHIYSGQIILYLPFCVTLIMDQSIQFLAPYPLVLVLLSTMLLPKIVYENKENSLI